MLLAYTDTVFRENQAIRTQAYTCAVLSHSPTTQELLKRAQALIHLDQDYLKDFNAAIDQLQKKQETFQAEHPPFGSRYS